MHFSFRNPAHLSLSTAVEILGLFRDDVFLFYHDLGAERQETFGKWYAKIGSIGSIKLPVWKDSAFWSGDEWLVVFAASWFAFAMACQGSEPLQDRLRLFKLHLDYLGVLLQESMTRPEISSARQVCIQWREGMVERYGKAAMAFPNFHAILRKFFSPW